MQLKKRIAEIVSHC